MGGKIIMKGKEIKGGDAVKEEGGDDGKDYKGEFRRCQQYSIDLGGYMGFHFTTICLKYM